jgi:hypothetical protein
MSSPRAAEQAAEAGKSVLPSFLLWPTLAAGAWVTAGPFLTDAATWEKVVLGPLPGMVVIVLTLTDYVIWRRRGRPWHDWLVILLLLPPIFAAVWVAVGALALRASYDREELLGIAVGPGVALVGLLCTTISYHGRHHPDEWKLPGGAHR